MTSRAIVFALLGFGSAAALSAQQFVIKVTADNHYAFYTGTASVANVRHGTGSWPVVAAPAPITPAAGDGYLYVAAWDDGSTYQGLLGTVQAGVGLVTTGSPLWTVCATSRPLKNNIGSAPTAAALTSALAVCNRTSSWHATSNGPNNDNALAAGLWGQVAQIDGTASWIWDTDGSAACAGTNGFLKGACNPGEYLIFRLPLAEAAKCAPPVPDFEIDPNAGFGQLVANASASQNEVSHFWSIEESDQFWNRFPPEITQWFPNQQAGIFDLKAFFEGHGQRLKCDTYYRVKLALANSCVSWRDTSKLVKVKCCPPEVSCLDLKQPLITDTINWTVTEVPAGVPSPAAPFAVPGTVFSSTAANWITAVGDPGANSIGGYFTYQYRFCLCPGFSSPNLSFSLCTDNEADAWLNNPNPVANPTLNKIGTTGPNLVCVPITAPAGFFVPGTNILTIRVRNRGVGGNPNSPTPTGLAVNGTLTATHGQCRP